MYTLKIRLNPLEYEGLIQKWFDKGYTLKKASARWFNKQERDRRNSEEYQYLAKKTKEQEELKNKINETKDKTQKAALKAELKELSDFLKESWKDLNNAYGLNSGKFVRYKELGQASHLYNLYSAQALVHWSSFEAIAADLKAAYLIRKKQAKSDNFLSAGRYDDFTTLTFRKFNNRVTEKGIYFDKLDKKTNKKVKIFIPFNFKENDEERLTYGLEFFRVALFKLKRKRNPKGKWIYFVLITFDGKPYGVDSYESGKGKVTVSVDVDKLAIKAESSNLKEPIYYDIANDFGYSEILSELDRKIEWKRRINNPDNYEENGVIKKGARKWYSSKEYRKLLAKKRNIWYKIEETRKQKFNKIAKEIIQLGDEIIVMKQDFKSLQQRLEYNKEEMNWFDKRRQRGAEIMFNAPYQFILALKERANYKNIEVVEVVKK